MPLLVTILKLPLPVEMDCCIRLVANVVELELNPIFKLSIAFPLRLTTNTH